MQTRKVNAEIVKLAQDIVSGRLNMIIGCRKLRQLAIEIGIANNDIFIPILGVESETDNFPIGEVRKEYDSVLLDRLDYEMASYIDRIRPSILIACKKIVMEYES